MALRSPTCQSCLRRITAQTSYSPATPFLTLTQIRRKHKQKLLVVRLLQDVDGFGRAETILRTPAGRMRNYWYPSGTAEYMTAVRLKELGLSEKDISERNFTFTTAIEGVDDGLVERQMAAVDRLLIGTGSEAKLQLEPPQPSVEIEHVLPDRAQTFLIDLIPETLTFSRQLIKLPATQALNAPPAPEAPAGPARSPLLAAQSRISSAARLVPTHAPEAMPEMGVALVPEPDPDQGKIHGSVTLRHIAVEIKNRMVLDPEAAKIHVEPHDIKFVDLEDGVDNVKHIGKWEIEIIAHSGRNRVPPVRKYIEVVPS